MKVLVFISAFVPATALAAPIAWAQVVSFHHTYRIVASEKPVIKAAINGQDGLPLYLFVCRNGDDESVPDVIYTGDLECRLIPYEEGEVEDTILIETHNERTPAWFSRGRMLANELYGKCANYPEYGAVRHFLVRGMRVTLTYSNIQFDLVKSKVEPTLISYTMTVDIVPDATATRDIAKASGFMDPSRSHYDCSKIVKGVDLPDTHDPWPTH